MSTDIFIFNLKFSKVSKVSYFSKYPHFSYIFFNWVKLKHPIVLKNIYLSYYLAYNASRIVFAHTYRYIVNGILVKHIATVL